MDTKEIDQLIRALLTNPNISTKKIDETYKHLAKQTHPDLSGGESEAFIYVNNLFEMIRKNRSGFPKGSRIAANRYNYDKVVRDFGINSKIDSRMAFYLGFYRMNSIGIFSMGFYRNSFHMRHHQATILSCLYWSKRHDRTIHDILVDSLGEASKNGLNLPSMEFLDVSKNVSRCIELFTMYQDLGRSVTKDICIDLAHSAQKSVQKDGRNASNRYLALLLGWLVQEIRKDPVIFLIDL